MNAAERLAAVRGQLERLKATIAAGAAAKEADVDWARDGRDAAVQFSFNVRRSLKGHFGKVYCLDWGGDNTTLMSASQDGKLILWNAFTENKLDAVSLKSAWVMACAFEKDDGRFVAAGGLDNACSVYDLRNPGAPTAELVGHDGYLADCSFLERKYMLTCSGDATAALWDLERGGVMQARFVDHAADVMSIAPHPADPNTFATGSCDTTVRVWDIRAGRSVQSFTGHVSDVNSVAWMPAGGGFTLGSGSDDASCRMWDLRSRGPVGVYAGACVCYAGARTLPAPRCSPLTRARSPPRPYAPRPARAHPRPTAICAPARPPPAQRTGCCAA